MRSISGDFLFSLFHLLVGVDAVGGDFDFGNAAEGEQKLYEVLGRLFRSLFYNVANGVSDRGLEHDTLGLQAGKVHAHELAGLEHHFSTKILAPRGVKSKLSPAIRLTPANSLNHLRPRHVTRLIEQRVHTFEESHGVRQSCVLLERRRIHPPRMNEKQPPVPDRPERVKTHAADLLPRRPSHFAQGLLHGTLLPLASMQAHEDILVHAPSTSLLHYFLPLTVH